MLVEARRQAQPIERLAIALVLLGEIVERLNRLDHAGIELMGDVEFEACAVAIFGIACHVRQHHAHRVAVVPAAHHADELLTRTVYIAPRSQDPGARK